MIFTIGASVAVVENGRQALERLENWTPDIAFLDIRMPVLDGAFPGNGLVLVIGEVLCKVLAS